MTIAASHIAGTILAGGRAMCMGGGPARFVHFGLSVAADGISTGMAWNGRSREGRIALARSEGRIHPVLGLWLVHLAGTLRAFLDKSETFKVRAFAEQAADLAFADFPVVGGRDQFFNINTPDELQRAETLVGEDT